MSSASDERGGLPDRPHARGVQLARGRRPDAPQPLDRQRMQELELALGRHDEQAVGLGRAARDLREDLRPRDADAERQPGLLAHLAAQPRGDLGRRAAPRRVTSRNASSIDRGSTTGAQRRKIVEHRPAGLDVRPPARVDDDRVRAAPPRPRVLIPLRTPYARAS